MWGATSGKSPVGAERRVAVLERYHFLYATLEAFRASDFDGESAVIERAIAGGPALFFRVVATGTTGGAQTADTDLFSDLSLGEIITGSGCGYTLPDDQAISPRIFGAGAALSAGREATQYAIDYVSVVREGGTVYVPTKWTVDDEILLKEGVRLKGPGGRAKCQFIATAGVGAMPVKLSRNVTSCPIVAIEGVNNVELNGIGLIGSVGLATGSENESGGLFIDDAEDVTIEKCLIKNCREYHVAIGSDNQVSRCDLLNNHITADLDTLKASHYSNLLVLTYLDTADISGNVMTSDPALAAPTSIQGFINTENWGVGTCENKNVSIIGNTVKCGQANSIGISKTGGNVINHIVSGNKLANCSIRYTGNIRSLKVQGNALKDITSREFAISMEGCAGTGGKPAIIDITGNTFETSMSGIQILNNSTSADKSIINVINNVGQFGSDTSAPRYGLSWQSVDNLHGVVSLNDLYSASAANDCYAYRFYSTDNFVFRNNYGKAYTGATIENTCDTVEIGPNTFDCTVRYANKSMQRGSFEDRFKHTFAGTSAETFYTTTTRENGTIRVTTADNANNSSKIYAGMISFSRAGFSAPVAAEFGEANAANMAFSVSSAALQVTRSSSSVADTLWVHVSSMFS